MRALVFLLSLISLPVAAQDRAGAFDYYVLSLSWSPNWCALEGDARNSPQCAEGSGFGWILHGLWPQYEVGYPEFCSTSARPPSRNQTAEMADIMGTSGLAWHQWRKHGVCTGLSSDDYYALSRVVYDRIVRPQVFRDLNRPVTLGAPLIEAAFLRENPGLRANQITVTCRDRHIQEVRICMTRDLDFRDCAPDIRRDCSLSDATFNPMR
jgi:ribonuclease T2